MRLVIRRDQAQVKGMLGGNKGVSFTLSYQLQLTDQEQRLVDHYRLHEYPLTFKTIQGTQIPDDTVGNMLAGRSQTIGDVITLVRNERVIVDACDQLPALFDLVASFGGSEVIDYPRTAEADR